jgi:hypothetical protein
LRRPARTGERPDHGPRAARAHRGYVSACLRARDWSGTVPRCPSELEVAIQPRKDAGESSCQLEGRILKDIARAPIRAEVRLPGILSLGTDDVGSLFRRRNRARGPFILIGRDSGLAVDTGLQDHRSAEPILWPAHAFVQQLWYFQRTNHRASM